MDDKINCRYSFEVLDFNCNDFGSCSGFTFNVGVPYLDIIIRHQWFRPIQDDVYQVMIDEPNLK